MNRELGILVTIAYALLLVGALALSIFHIVFYPVQAGGITPGARNAPKATEGLPVADVASAQIYGDQLWLEAEDGRALVLVSSER